MAGRQARATSTLMYETSLPTHTGCRANAVYGWKTVGDGNINIDVRGGTSDTTGEEGHSVYGWHTVMGDITITVRDLTSTTAGETAHSITTRHTAAVVI